jgi:hypothetical protein
VLRQKRAFCAAPKKQKSQIQKNFPHFFRQIHTFPKKRCAKSAPNAQRPGRGKGETFMLNPPPNPAKPTPPSSQPSQPTDPTSQNLPNPPTFEKTIGNSPDAHDDDNLSETQRSAITLLLLGQSDTAVAKKLSLNRRTIYDWKKNHAPFREELQRRRDELCDCTLNLFLRGLQTSVQALTKQAADLYAPTSHRAARTLLTASRLGQHLYKLTDPKLPPK